MDCEAGKILRILVSGKKALLFEVGNLSREGTLDFSAF